jgi:alkylation response protein AidB-like acyl-CoA dehydrogenase
MTQAMIANSEIDTAAARSTSIAKAFTAETVWRAADRPAHICGARGISGRILFILFTRFSGEGWFRIHDGPSGAHRRSIARAALRRVASPLAAAATGGARLARS